MVLSKDEIGNTEEAKTSENTSSKKRRQRRQRLRAAKVQILNNVEQNNAKEHTANTNVLLDTGPINILESSVDKQAKVNQNKVTSKKVSSKTQKFTCPILDKNHKSKELSGLENTQKSKELTEGENKQKTQKAKEITGNNQLSQKSDEPSLVENNDGTAKNQDSNSDNQKSKSKTKTPTLKNSVTNEGSKCKCGSVKQQKSKPKNSTVSDNLKTKSESQVLVESQKIKSENSSLTKKTKKEDLGLPENQIPEADKQDSIADKTVKSEEKVLTKEQKAKSKEEIAAKKQKTKLDTLTENQILPKEKKVLNKDQRVNSEKPILLEKQQTKVDTPIIDENQALGGKDLETILLNNNITKLDSPVLIENQTPKIEKKVLPQNQKEKPEKKVLLETQQTKIDTPILVENQKRKSEEILGEKQKSKVESKGLTQNQKLKSESLTERKTELFIQDVASKQTIPVVTESQKSKSDNITSIGDYKSGTEYNISVVDQNSKPNVLNNHSSKSLKPELKNQEYLSRSLNYLIENLKSLEVVMGKAQHTQDSQKVQVNKDLNTENAPSTDTSTSKDVQDVKAARQARKLAKQKAKKKNDATGDGAAVNQDASKLDTKAGKENDGQKIEVAANKTKVVAPASDCQSKENTSRSDVPKTSVEKVKEKLVAKSKPDNEGKAVDKGETEDGGKSKAELRAERRAKQEAQRAAKQAAAQAKAPSQPKPDVKEDPVKTKEEKPTKTKSLEKPKLKAQAVQRVGWFQHLHTESDKDSLKNIAINSNLHPAVIKLGVQLASHVVSGSNARCIALLDALKKMVRDYTLPARTEFARGLEAQLTASADFLCAVRRPAASETNALKYFRRQLTQLPNNVDEFDAKKTLQEEIDRYIREQIDMAGEAISITVRKKISTGDNILTYGCSSLIERILVEAWEAGVRFQAIVVGTRAGGGAAGAEMLRRLRARAVPASYVDIAALSYVMCDVQKVVLGAASLLANGAVVGAAGGAAVALVARARNVPVLVAAETHKFSERATTDAFVYDETGDPDDLIDTTDENSPLKDWRSNPNISLLNLTYDITPPSLVTAVVTELGILPCTSAPVVLRFKMSEYGM